MQIHGANEVLDLISRRHAGWVDGSSRKPLTWAFMPCRGALPPCRTLMPPVDLDEIQLHVDNLHTS
jgi:hypothetical protein